MGGLFTTPQQIPPSLPESRRYMDERLAAQLSQLSLNNRRRLMVNSEGRTYRPSLGQIEAKQVQLKWSRPNLTFKSASDEDLTLIRSLIKNKNLVIDSAQKICNSYLTDSYELKKRQKMLRYQNMQEKWLFHGTKRINYVSISKDNFDWRRHGDSVGHIYGQGVSFSCNAVYASHYSDKCKSKIFIIAKVLIGQTCNGNKDMVIPDRGADTALKNNTYAVAVKFEDAEYLPFYLVEYHYRPGFVPNRGQHNRTSIKNYSTVGPFEW